MLPFLLVAAALGGSAPDTAFARIVASQFKRFPLMTVTDLYKLTHQAAFGAEHATADSATAARWLEREWDALGPSIPEPLYDTIAPGGAVVRLNLRIWREQGGSPAPVLRAFLESGRLARRDVARFERYWATVVQLARARRIPFDPGELSSHGARMRIAGYPAVSHSAAFRAIYRPAYRVVIPRTVRPTDR